MEHGIIIIFIIGFFIIYLFIYLFLFSFSFCVKIKVHFLVIFFWATDLDKPSSYHNKGIFWFLH